MCAYGKTTPNGCTSVRVVFFLRPLLDNPAPVCSQELFILYHPNLLIKGNTTPIPPVNVITSLRVAFPTKWGISRVQFVLNNRHYVFYMYFKLYGFGVIIHRDANGLRPDLPPVDIIDCDNDIFLPSLLGGQKSMWRISV